MHHMAYSLAETATGLQTSILRALSAGSIDRDHGNERYRQDDRHRSRD
jgi:hypothetical protein